MTLLSMQVERRSVMVILKQIHRLVEKRLELRDSNSRVVRSVLFIIHRNQSTNKEIK